MRKKPRAAGWSCSYTSCDPRSHRRPRLHSDELGPTHQRHAERLHPITHTDSAAAALSAAHRQRMGSELQNPPIMACSRGFGRSGEQVRRCRARRNEKRIAAVVGPPRIPAVGPAYPPASASSLCLSRQHTPVRRPRPTQVDRPFRRMRRARRGRLAPPAAWCRKFAAGPPASQAKEKAFLFWCPVKNGPQHAAMDEWAASAPAFRASLAPTSQIVTSLALVGTSF